jgi:hypothetical protein
MQGAGKSPAPRSAYQTNSDTWLPRQSGSGNVLPAENEGFDGWIRFRRAVSADYCMPGLPTPPIKQCRCIRV